MPEYDPSRVDTEASSNAERSPEPQQRQARCAVCGNIAAFQFNACAELPAWGPPCARCQNEFTELVPLAAELAAEAANAMPSPDQPAVPRDSSRVTRAVRFFALRGLASDHSSRARGPLLTITEFWYTRRASRRLLRLHDAVRRELPTQPKRARYEEVVGRWAGIDLPAARAVLERAEQSVSDWDTDRDLRFFDVVLYVVSDDYLRAHPERHGARSRIAQTVGRVISRHL